MQHSPMSALWENVFLTTYTGHTVFIFLCELVVKTGKLKTEGGGGGFTCNTCESDTPLF